jgi:hypothetical protein
MIVVHLDHWEEKEQGGFQQGKLHKCSGIQTKRLRGPGYGIVMCCFAVGAADLPEGLKILHVQNRSSIHNILTRINPPTNLCRVAGENVELFGNALQGLT